MKRLELVSLTLRNFKGIREFTLTLNGRDALVTGANATGKTTLADAYNWLLFGRDTAGRKDFDIKTLDAAGAAASGVDHEVEGVLAIDGDEITLTKQYHEVWTKPRGARTDVLSGHTTEHLIDGVPINKGEYDARISDILDEATWRLLSDPGAFNALHWQKRRTILLDVCGDVESAEVYAAHPKLADLPGILGKRSIDEHRKVVAARRSELNEKLRQLPARIDEVMRGAADAPAGKRESIEVALAGVRRERAALEKERAALATGSAPMVKERARTRELDDLMHARKRSLESADEDVERARKRVVSDALAAIADAERELRGVATDHADETRRARTLDARVAVLRDEYANAYGRKPPAHTLDTCPTCKQRLPADQVAAAHERALAAFNAEKGEQLERLAADGKARAAEAASARAHVDELVASITAREASITELRETHAALAFVGSKMTTPDRAPLEEQPEYLRMQAERDELMQAIAGAEAGDPDALERLDRQAAHLDESIAEFEGIIATFEARKRADERVEELKEQERTLSAEHENLERALYLMDEYTKAQVAMLEQRVDAHFSFVGFRLFREQVNGGIEPCCDLTVDGVPFASVNHAGQVQAGLDVIRTLQEHHQALAPVWIDARESISVLPALQCQCISLIVSAEDESLRVETREREHA